MNQEEWMERREFLLKQEKELLPEEDDRRAEIEEALYECMAHITEQESQR